jgi:hypothetical protein
MSNIFYLNNLKPADRIVMPKSNIRLIQHHVIYIGKDQQGNRMFIENAIGKGVQLINEAYLFRDGYQVTRIEPFKGNLHQRHMAVKAALKMIGKEYDLINFNCEHYANSVQYNKSYSSQVGNGIIISLLTTLIVGAGLSRS